MTPTDRIRPLATLRSSALRGVRSHYERDRLIEIRAPVLVGLTGACESVSSILAVEGTPLLLSQTGQLALQSSLTVACGVWCHTGSYRREVVDERHLCEFELIEEEIPSRHPAADGRAAAGEPEALFELLLQRIEAAVKAMLAEAFAASSDEIAELGGDLEVIATTLETEFPRMTYGDALRTLTAAGAEQVPEWGDDLETAHERALLAAVEREHGEPRPLFVTHFPEEIKFFNMLPVGDGSRTVHSADLLLPHAHEAVGGAVRDVDRTGVEERFRRRLLSQLPEASVPDAEAIFAPYFALLASGRLPPHAGYGIGLERVLQFIVQSTDIRQVSLPQLVGG